MSACLSLRKGWLILWILLGWVAGAPASDTSHTNVATGSEAAGALSVLSDRLSLAFAHYRLGQYAEAVALLENFLEASPEPADEEAARFLLGDCYFGAFDRGVAENAQSALAVYRSAVRQFPDSPLRARAIFRMAEIHHRRGDYLKAVFLSRKVSREHPDSAVTPWALHLHGKGLLAAKKDAAALHVLADVAREYPKHPVVLAVKTSLVSYHMERGDHPSALAQVEDLPREDLTNHRELAGVYGELLVRIQRTREAREVLHRLINRYPDDARTPRWMVLLGDAYGADGKRKEAMKVYYEVKTRFPHGQASVTAQAGILDLRLAEGGAGAFDQVDRAYGRLVAETGGTFDGLALARWANMLFRTKHYGRAVSAYQQFLSDFPDSRYFRQMTEDYGRALPAHLARLYEQEDFPRILEVAQTHRAALSGEVWSPEVGWLLAESHREMSFYRGALRSLDRLHREDPGALGDDTFVARLGETYLALGEFEAARETLKGFAKRFPKSRHGANVYAMRASVAFLEGDDAQAARNAQMSLRGKGPEQPEAIRFLLAAAHWRQGEREASLAQFRQVLPPAEAAKEKTRPPAVSGPARFAVADLLYELGRHRAALAAYHAAVEALPDDRNVPWARYRMGRIQWRLDREGEALKTFEAMGAVTDATLALLVEDAKEELGWQQSHGGRP